LSTKVLPRLVTVIDTNDCEYAFKSTGWEVTETGIVTIMLNDEPLATFCLPVAVGFQDRLTRMVEIDDEE